MRNNKCQCIYRCTKYAKSYEVENFKKTTKLET